VGVLILYASRLRSLAGGGRVFMTRRAFLIWAGLWLVLLNGVGDGVSRRVGAAGEVQVAASGPPGGERLTLLPIDDRPAVGQFAVMIGAVAGQRVEMPRRELLGNFTVPGDTARIEQWLRERDYRGTAALVISVDMLAYGGLVASRTPGVSTAEARKRLEFFRWFRQRYPRIPVYAFSVIMRVAPTASAATEGIHDQLARWAELKDRVPRTGDGALAAELRRLEGELAPRVIEDYLAARRRDLEINLAMIELAKAGVIDELILLQDDARQYGLHRQDQAVLRARLKELGMVERIPIYNGTDEGALSLVSRAILDRRKRQVRVAPVYSSARAREVIAPYEDHPLRFTVENQIRAAGGVLVGEDEEADYRLYINAPETTAAEFDRFRRRLVEDLQAGRPTALADLLFPAPHRSGADERLIEALRVAGLFDRLVGYAAWNTAGNTLGTAIPHANMRICLMKEQAVRKRQTRAGQQEAWRAEMAHLEFLLNRYAGDYIYHDLVRPEVNARRRAEAARTGTITYQLAAEAYAMADREVSQAMVPLITKFFDENFAGKRYRLLTGGEVTVKGLRDLRVYLPWARTFECVIEFRFDYEGREQ
jgi:hypothetical protein